MLKVILINFLLVISYKCIPRSCEPMSVKKAIKTSDLIFMGEVFKVDTVKVVFDNYDKNTLRKNVNPDLIPVLLATVLVKKRYKGKLTNNTVTIITGYDSNYCGFNFFVAKRYLIYSKKIQYALHPNKDNNTELHKKLGFSTTICDRTTFEILKEEKLLSAVLSKKNETINSQIKYSASDLSAIRKKNKELKTAEKNFNNAKLYELGLFYEKIYDKYKDTSMKQAIYCFELSTTSDGPEYYDQTGRNAAYRLGIIYEYGKGIAVNKKKAMIYYFLSDNMGQKDLERLQQSVCKNTEVIHNFTGNYQQADSLVLGFSPFCKIKGDAAFSSLRTVADFLKVNPTYRLSISVSEYTRGIPSPYWYWLQDYIKSPSLKRPSYHDVQNFIFEEQGIGLERILAPEIDSYTLGLSRITLKILRD